MRITILVILLTLLFWPVALYLANTPQDFVQYIEPTVFILLSFLLFRHKTFWYPLPLLLIPFVEAKLAIFPLAFAVTFLVQNKKRNLAIIFLVLSIVIFLVRIKPFWGQTIFILDYEARQEVVRKTQLYDSIFLARLFHNKARIILDKFTNNSFALIDPNNYFFGFHPRQIVGNQNLNKYPFLSIIFFAFGLYFIKDYKYKNFLFALLPSLTFSLSFLTIFDRNDFVLWAPITLLVLHGITLFSRKVKYAPLLFSLFFIFSITEFIRIFIQYLR